MVMIVCSFKLCECTESAVIFFLFFKGLSSHLTSCVVYVCYMSITVDLCYNCENDFAATKPDRSFTDF